MKKLIILFLFTLTSYQLVAQEIDERITDIYFGNGILTTEEEAHYAKKYILGAAVLINIYNDDKVAMQAKHGDEYNAPFFQDQ